MVAAIRDAHASLDPNNQAAYQQNSAYDIRQIEELDREIMAQWATLPPDQRKLVTSHEAFGYYAARYGITFIGSVLSN
jgi:ABC-type Zn uptake system ZnuABC Zn-binding protein ZnuA